MENFDEFNEMYNEDGSFDYTSLGEPDVTNEFEKNGVTFIERIWVKNGRELKHLELKDGANGIKGSIISSESVDPRDISEAFKFRKTLPLNFLNMLQAGAEKYNDMFDTKHFKRRKVETIDEKIERLNEEKCIAVDEQRYEDAADLRNKVDDLIKERDGGK